MAEDIKLEWRWRETNDSEFGSARWKCFDVAIRDCDGDFTTWSIKRGGQYIVSGTCGGVNPHADIIKLLRAMANGTDAIMAQTNQIFIAAANALEWPYHREQAQAQVIEMLRHCWEAVELNDYRERQARQWRCVQCKFKSSETELNPGREGSWDCPSCGHKMERCK